MGDRESEECSPIDGEARPSGQPGTSGRTGGDRSAEQHDVVEVREFRQYRFRRPQGACEMLLVRHGESAPYREGTPHPLIDGQGDPALDPVGEDQARRLAERLVSNGEPIAAIYATTMQRTAQTAVPLAEALGIDVVVEPRLREVHLGEWEGGEFRRRVRRRRSHRAGARRGGSLGT